MDKERSIHPVISIIIPIYNRINTIVRCLDSVKEQTFQDWEALLIDDGSSDGSEAICDRYAIDDSRFHVIHKHNEGVSKARQDGICQAQGVYVIHMDSDDWAEPDMLQSLYDKAIADNADMVICDFWKESQAKLKYCKQRPQLLEADAIVKEMLFQQLHGSCCNKLVRRVCYNESNVFFPPKMNIFEDLFVTCQLLRNHPKISYIPKAFYHYVIGQTNDNLTRRVSIKSVEEKQLFVQLMSESRYTNEPEELFLFKKDVLMDLFFLRQYQLMYSTYPEIQSRIVSEKKLFNIFAPNGYILAEALRGNLHYANFLLKISAIAQGIKRLIYKIFHR